MPIYSYRCDICGHAKDVLQKMSDPLLTVCPACGAPDFKKQLTAAGFQLKGSGWYVTDFRDGGNNTKDAAKAADKESGNAKEGEKTPEKSAAEGTRAGDGNAAAAPAAGSKDTKAPAASPSPVAALSAPAAAPSPSSSAKGPASV